MIHFRVFVATAGIHILWNIFGVLFLFDILKNTPDCIHLDLRILFIVYFMATISLSCSIIGTIACDSWV